MNYSLILAALVDRWSRRLPLMLALCGTAGCATVRPEQRAVLADPIMQFDNVPGEEAARAHVLENREGAVTGGAVRGGGCGCN